LLAAAAAHTTWCAGDDLQPPYTSACTVPIVLYAWNRPDYLRRSLARLAAINARVMALPDWPPHVPALQVVLSLDGADAAVLASLQDALAAAQGSSLPLPVLRVLIHPVASWHPHGSSRGILNLKAHWSWMMGQVFGNVPELAGHEGAVLFLEEDMEPSLDALHVFRWLAGEAEARCADCWGGALSVGGFADAAQPQQWLARTRGIHSNGGYFFNRTVWRAMAAAASHFDRFVDGWDWAMVHMVQAGVIPPRAAVPDVSRVRNFGTVGITVTKRFYESSGLGSSPSSDATPEDFLAAARGGQLRALDVPLEGGPASVGNDPLSANAAAPADTISKCPVCAAAGITRDSAAAAAASAAASSSSSSSRQRTAVRGSNGLPQFVVGGPRRDEEAAG
jgi:hypothetical protein